MYRLPRLIALVAFAVAAGGPAAAADVAAPTCLATAWWNIDGIGTFSVTVILAMLAAGCLIAFNRRQVARHTADLRERMCRELELEAEHKDLIENANDIIFTLDRHNRITSFNRAGERLTGFKREEVIGRTLAELAYPNSKSSTLQCSCNGSLTFEMNLETRAGRSLVLEVSARPAKRNGVLAATNCIARDVTERKRAHDDLRRLYLIQSQQFDHSPLAFIEWDGSFRVVRWSRQAERIFGYTAEQAAGKSYDEIVPIHEDDVDRVRAVFAELVAGLPFSACRNRNHTRSGELKTIEWYNSTLLDDSGKLLCVMSLAQDITDRERDEEERRRLEDQVRQSQKMEAVGRLAGGVAHDFNNLLTVINGCSEMLLTEAAPGDPARGLAEEIRRAGEQAVSLTRQLLAFARRQITAPVALDLNDVVRDVEKMLRRLIGEHIELAVQLDARPARIKADPGLMVQLLMNLAVNARDAMPHGGVLSIRTAAEGERVVITVADNGIGMDAVTKARIFEPFFTTKPPGEGTGLGLSTVHGIVEQAKGAISVDSELERGTTFVITFPACADASVAKSTAFVRRSELTPRETILLVEDEDLVRSLAQRVLESRGYRVYAAPSGADAIDLHGQAAGHVDLLLTDVVMPGLGGRHLAESLQHLQPNLPVIFMSGYTSDEVLREGIQGEAVNFIQKPFSPDALIRKVRDVLQPGRTATLA